MYASPKLGLDINNIYIYSTDTCGSKTLCQSVFTKTSGGWWVATALCSSAQMVSQHHLEILILTTPCYKNSYEKYRQAYIVLTSIQT